MCEFFEGTCQRIRVTRINLQSVAADSESVEARESRTKAYFFGGRSRQLRHHNNEGYSSGEKSQMHSG
jgi:hypothetical protein